ncbi:MAG TPA: tetratricopeptide repeat protein [Opitutus sp.]|nr:tetratricopeptide repeat protein [Opitutus sp.]
MSSEKIFAVRPALRTWAVACALFAGTVLLFWRVVPYEFLNYDDPRYLTSNAHVQAGLAWSSVVWAFTAPTDYWHPLTWLSHMLDWQLYGGEVAGHHLTSIFWHAANAVLVFLLLRRLTGAFWSSALAAALFAWHPLRVESVAWITERKDVMSGCFFLLTLWAYAAYAACRDAGRPAARRYALTLALFLAGLMSKPMLVSVPLVLLVLDFWPLHRFAPGARNWRPLLIEKIPFVLLAAAIAAVTLLMQRGDGAFVLHLPLGARLGNAVVSVVRYVGKFLWPFDLTVCYPHPGYWPAGTVVGAALALVALTALAWRQRRARPWLLGGWLWFLVVLSPVLGVVQVGFQAMADRYTYLANLGLEFALLWTLRDAAVRPVLRAGLAAGAVAVLAGYAVRTWDQEAVWRDPVALFEHALAVTDHNSTAEGFLAYTFASEGRFERAEPHARRALAANPQDRPALFALARTEETHGRIADAMAHYRALLRLNPGDDESEFSLGLLLLSRNQRDEALTHFRAVATREPVTTEVNLQLALAAMRRGDFTGAALRYNAAILLDPANAVAHFGFGLAVTALGHSDAGLEEYLAAARLQPDFAAAHKEAGLLLLLRERVPEAEAHFRAAVAAQPMLAVAHVGLGRALVREGRPDEALPEFERAVALAPADPDAQRALADSLARARRFDEAVPHYQRALLSRPDDAAVHAALGYALYLSGRREEGMQAWRDALKLDPNFPGLRARLEAVIR